MIANALAMILIAFGVHAGIKIFERHTAQWSGARWTGRGDGARSHAQRQSSLTSASVASEELW